MKKGSLFFIGLVSAIITVISLNYAFGRSVYYAERYPYYNRYHHCNERYNRDENRSEHDRQKQSDTTNSNY